MFSDGSSFNTEYMDVLKDIFSKDHKDLGEDSIGNSDNANDSLNKFKKDLENTSSSNFKPNDDGTGNSEDSDSDVGA